MRDLMVLILGSSLIYVFGTALFGQVFMLRKISVYFRIALLGIVTLPLIWLLRFYISNSYSWIYFYDSVGHLSLGVIFAQFICLPDRALTLRILVEILETQNRGLNLTDLKNRFSLSVMIQSRLLQMQKGDLLYVDQNGKIILKSKGNFIGNLVLNGRKFYNISSAN